LEEQRGVEENLSKAWSNQRKVILGLPGAEDGHGGIEVFAVGVKENP